MPKFASPFANRTIPKVAKRLKFPEWQLRRAVGRGDVKTDSWAGREFIPPAEEARLEALLEEVRAPLSGARKAG